MSFIFNQCSSSTVCPCHWKWRAHCCSEHVWLFDCSSGQQCSSSSDVKFILSICKCECSSHMEICFYAVKRCDLSICLRMYSIRASQWYVCGPECLKERAGVCLFCLCRLPVQSQATPPTSASDRLKYWPLKSRMGLNDPRPFTGATRLQPALLTEPNGLIQIVCVCLCECAMFTARMSFLLHQFLWNADRAGEHLVCNHGVFVVLRSSWKVFKRLTGSMQLTDSRRAKGTIYHLSSLFIGFSFFIYHLNFLDQIKPPSSLHPSVFCASHHVAQPRLAWGFLLCSEHSKGKGTLAAWQLAKKLNNHIVKLHVVSAPRPYTATGNCFHIGILDFLFQSDSSARLDLPPPHSRSFGSYCFVVNYGAVLFRKQRLCMHELVCKGYILAVLYEHFFFFFQYSEKRPSTHSIRVLLQTTGDRCWCH